MALIDCNGIQADGAIVLDMEPVADKWRAFGWQTQEIDGNDMEALVAALIPDLVVIDPPRCDRHHPDHPRHRGASRDGLHARAARADGEAVRPRNGKGLRGVVTAENHVTRGGLGTQVVEALYDAGVAKPLARIGIPDAFIELASVPTLAERFGLTPQAIVSEAASLLA